MSDSFIILPSSGLAAIYDDEVKRLYLWSKGAWNTAIVAGFQRDPDWVGGLKFILQGIQEGSGLPADLGQTAATMFEVSLRDPEAEDGMIKKVLVETAAGVEEVKISMVDTVRAAW